MTTLSVTAFSLEYRDNLLVDAARANVSSFNAVIKDQNLKVTLYFKGVVNSLGLFIVTIC